MKSKLVIWGSNAQDEKIMIAVALRADENKVDIWTFPESVATEDFYQQMMKEWRDGEGMEMPEPHTFLERELSISEGLLPDDIKVERTDVVQRAQTEWHFLVLSAKLHQSYEDQVKEMKEQVEKLKEFDDKLWGNLKEFWDKVQGQVRERNLLRSHADKLRDNINVLFVRMKELRTQADAEFERFSKDNFDNMVEALNNVEKKVEEGARLPVMFDELKKLQRKFRESKLTREHRAKIWEKLDATFKIVKDKRFGGKGAPVESGSSAYVRMQHRFNGLVSAIEKMEQSIKRDKNDLSFQQHKIDTTDGQLEAQIRQAKIVMIEERVRSKVEKLNEMISTRTDLEKRLASLKEKEARQAAQAAVKEKIAEEIKHAAEVRVEEMPELEKAAEEIKEAQAEKAAPKAAKAAKKEESIMDAIGATLGESVEDLVDSVKAVASVIGDKIGDAIDDLKEDLKETKEEVAAAMKNGEDKADDELDTIMADAAAVDVAVSSQFGAEKDDEKA
jgi:hypothetical protein